MNKKQFKILIVSVLSAFLLLLVGSFLYSKLSTVSFYARVKETYSSSSIIEPIETEKTHQKYPVLQIDKGNLESGSIIKIVTSKKMVETYPPIAIVKKIDVIIKNDINQNEQDKVLPEVTKTTSKMKTDKISSKPTKKVEYDKTTTSTKPTTTQITTKNIKTTTTTKYNNKDEMVLKTLEDNVTLLESNKNNQKLGEKAKEFFMNGVDFIFYNEPINGIYFNDLTSKAKLKAIGLVLKIDNIIDNKYPNYKDSLSSKYQNTKSKLVELYLEKTTEYCANHDEVCDEAKSDFSLLKKSTNITWDTIKSLGNKGINKLKEWYEIYSGK